MDSSCVQPMLQDLAGRSERVYYPQKCDVKFGEQQNNIHNTHCVPYFDTSLSLLPSRPAAPLVFPDGVRTQSLMIPELAVSGGTRPALCIVAVSSDCH